MLRDYDNSLLLYGIAQNFYLFILPDHRRLRRYEGRTTFRCAFGTFPGRWMEVMPACMAWRTPLYTHKLYLPSLYPFHRTPSPKHCHCAAFLKRAPCILFAFPSHPTTLFVGGINTWAAVKREIRRGRKRMFRRYPPVARDHPSARTTRRRRRTARWTVCVRRIPFRLQPSNIVCVKKTLFAAFQA